MEKSKLKILKPLLKELFEEKKKEVIADSYDGDEKSFKEDWKDDPFEVDDGVLLGISWALDTVKTELKK